jgi:hypothetical protein
MTDETVRNQRRLPDPEICRTRYLGCNFPFSYCLAENPDTCKHAVRSGSGVFCRHPDRRSFEKPDRQRRANSRLSEACLDIMSIISVLFMLALGIAGVVVVLMAFCHRWFVRRVLSSH